MKIIITGLPYFGKKISAALMEVDPNNNYIFLNTYYSNYDRLRFLFHILTAKVVYSINGTTGKSFVLNLAMKLKKRVVFHWVGTDVVLAKDSIRTNQANEKFISYPVHLTDSPWFVGELKEIGIHADYSPLLVVNNVPVRRTIPAEFKILLYIPQADQEYYGLSVILEVAKQFPEIIFNIAGSECSDLPVSENVKFLGWIKDMSPLFSESSLTIRFVKHDGLSFFVLESLLNECHVIYNYDLKYCLKANNHQQISSYINDLFEKFKKSEFSLNTDGREYVVREFTVNNIQQLSQLLIGK